MLARSPWRKRGQCRWATFDPGDIPLSARGEAQARDLANRLTGVPDLIVHSPFLRTYQTAVPRIARYPDVPVVVWPIQEFTYLSSKHCAETTGAQRRSMVEDYWRRCDPAFVDGAGAESFSAFLSRVRLLHARLQDAPDAFIVVFAHGQLMQALRLITAMPDADDETIMAILPAYDRNNPIGNTR
ncbi:histidine phosphatase family protein [Kozakia baliensis]|uniref:Uncharacterized protein n=1 Tax=Kozakia baliensis TaxID=153496 RepID=A0A1D8UYU8_9PROT|nr:histidine phosphatase family protein [Kozakia baliensis]AOX18878.1 hypothetical protein A0U89_16405 [Kozakia baliensis]GBR27890.1 phosphoglycerate mutase [Kozakia baliensis NRIC 0488]GEL65343.1 phosphoglycerate kinase [Kozakia baliensis]